MREVSPALALCAKEGVGEESKVGVQIQDVDEIPGHTEPPCVYLISAYQNGSISSAVVDKAPSGASEAYEFPNPSTYADKEGPKQKAAEMIQSYIDGLSESDTPTIFFAGSEETTDKLIERLDIPEYFEVKKDGEQAQYVP